MNKEEEFDDWFKIIGTEEIMCERGHNNVACDFVEIDGLTVFVCEQCMADYENQARDSVNENKMGATQIG